MFRAGTSPTNNERWDIGVLQRLWLRAWLFSALGAVIGAVVSCAATLLVWHWQGWQPGQGGEAVEIKLFLYMVLGGLLGACLGGLLAVQEPQEVSLTAATGGCLTYFLGLQVVVILLYVFYPPVWRGEIGTWGRLQWLLLAACVGALLPPLITRLVLGLSKQWRKNKTDPD